MKSDLQLRLCLDTLDVEVHRTQRDVRADIQLDQIENFGLERHMGPQILHIELNLFDIQHRNVEIHIRRPLVDHLSLGVVVRFLFRVDDFRVFRVFRVLGVFRVLPVEFFLVVFVPALVALGHTALPH